MKTIIEKIKVIFQGQGIKKSPKRIANDMYLECFIQVMQARTVAELMESKRLIKEFADYCRENKIPSKLELKKLKDEFDKSYQTWKRRNNGP